MKRSFHIVLVLTITAILAGAAHAAEILEIGAAEVCGNFNGVRPSLDVDSKGQPHIVIDSGHEALGSTMYMFNKINGSWTGRLFANRTTTPYTPSSISLPWIEIDSKDRAWVFAQFFQAGVMRNSGQGVWLYENMATRPTERWFHKKQFGRGWGPGNLQVDPHFPNETIVMTMDGYWGRINDAGTTTETGQMGPRASGEKFRFWISPRQGQPGIWHGVMNGSRAGGSSAYRNSLMGSDQVWATYNPYSSQGDDHNHPGVCGDLENPRIAYIASVYERTGKFVTDPPGLSMQIYNGNGNMIFGTDRLLMIDPDAKFVHRYAPSMAPAPGGGCWIAWPDKYGNIKMTYVSSAGEMNPPTIITRGAFCGINTDNDGNVHMAYVENGQTKYRKIRVSGAFSRESITRAADYDGDGIDDIAIFDPANGGWHLRLSRDGYANYNWGIPGDLPVPADYDASGKTDIAVFRPSESKWFIRKGDGSASEIQWGIENDIPAPGDYDKDGKADIAVYRPSEGFWYIRRSSDGKTAVRNDLVPAVPEEAILVPADFDGDGFMDIAYYMAEDASWHYVRSSDDAYVTCNWGADRDIPVPADYDGDGTDDICIFRPETGNWIGWASTAGYFQRNWGAPGDIVAPGDYDGDRVVDFTIFRPEDGQWYVCSSITGNFLENPPINWGILGDWPAPGDYDGDTIEDVAVFRQNDGNWYIRGSAGENHVLNWGAPGDRAVPADYDGDGADDPAVFRQSNGRWYLRGSGGEYRSIPWGAPGDWPVPGCYFTNVINIAVFRPSEGRWYIRDFDRARKDDKIMNWGAPGDWPVPYDYDGDGLTDIAIFRPSTGMWIGWLSTEGYGEHYWGAPGDWPLPGIGPEKIAVYRASERKIYIAGDEPLDIGSTPNGIPVVMDYDGDKINDPALFQYGNGAWWIKQTRDRNWAKAPRPLPWAWSLHSIPIGGRKSLK